MYGTKFTIELMTLWIELRRKRGSPLDRYTRCVTWIRNTREQTCANTISPSHDQIRSNWHYTSSLVCWARIIISGFTCCFFVSVMSSTKLFVSYVFWPAFVWTLKEGQKVFSIRIITKTLLISVFVFKFTDKRHDEDRNAHEKTLNKINWRDII